MSSALLPITVTLITRNEASRIVAAIQSVKSFATEIIVIDSESQDDTVKLAEALGARVVVKPFSGFGQQKNFAQDLASSEWVLNIDADERVTPELEREIREFFATGLADKIQGAYLPRKTWYLDRWVMHGGWYPNYLLRFSKKKSSRWSEPTLHEDLLVTGETIYFKNPLEHFSFPSQKSHILKNVEYARHASQGVLAKGKHARISDLILRPFWKFIDGYFIKMGFLDGRAGFFIAIHSAYATFLRYTYLHELTAPNTDSR